MPFTPPQIIEKTLSLLLPPACREEALGDLHEGCDSSEQYIREAVRLLPLVIFSRVRRTADPQVLLMQATVLYLCFLGAAWYQGKASLFEDSGLFRLAIPPAWVLLGLVLDDAYANPNKRSPVRPMRGPLLGFGFAYLSQVLLSTDHRTWALPPWIMFYGSAAGLFLSLAMKALFPPVIDRQVGAGGPAFWLKHAPEPGRVAPLALSMIKGFAFVAAMGFVGAQIGGSAPAKVLVILSVLFLILRELRRVQ